MEDPLRVAHFHERGAICASGPMDDSRADPEAPQQPVLVGGHQIRAGHVGRYRGGPRERRAVSALSAARALMVETTFRSTPARRNASRAFSPH